MAKFINSPLPDLFAGWMMDFLGGPLPTEVRATCDDCVMLKAPAVACKSDTAFHPNTKCCAFMPDLPNFLVGAVLADTSEDSAKRKDFFERGAIARGIIHPLGIYPTLKYSIKYKLDNKNFGQVKSLLCPYYVEEGGGLCSIWKYRNGQCSTWFCKHERGNLGVVFWKHLNALLAGIEQDLSRWCLLNFDYGSRPLLNRIPAPDEPITNSMIEWQNWRGRERELFVAWANAVQQLSWSDVWAIAGPETKKRGLQAQEAFQNYNLLSVPQRLKCGTWTAESCGGSLVRVWTYSKWDPLEIEAALLDALSNFDGQRSTAEALSCVQADPNVRLDSTLLQKLCDVGILVEEETVASAAAINT